MGTIRVVGYKLCVRKNEKGKRMKAFWKGQSKTAAFLLWEEMFYGKTDLHQPLHP